MVIKIRGAKKKDVDAIVGLEKELASYHSRIDTYYRSGLENRKGFKKFLVGATAKKNIKILVAEDDKKIIGFFIAFIIKDIGYLSPEKIGEIGMVFVDKRYRRSRIGEKGIKEISKWFRNNKVKHIEVNVDRRNKVGFNAWKKYGFKEYIKRMKLEL